MPSRSTAIHTWLTTSKKSAQVVFGLNVQNFHWHVFPMPISVSDTQGPFTLRDTQEPIAPDTAITEREITFYITGLQSNHITAHQALYGQCTALFLKLMATLHCQSLKPLSLVCKVQ
jgi:hypothetical protein